MSREVINQSALDQLGESMRMIRQRAKVTLIEMGSDPNAPRSWSHSHLSRCERGYELPTADLVAWYEVKSGVQKGFLEELRRQAAGEPLSSGSDEVDNFDSDFILDRLELLADFSGKEPRVFQPRDLVVRSGEGISSYQLLVDTYDPTRPLADYPLEISYGGVFATTPRFQSGTLTIFEIDLERQLNKGDFHRLQLFHILPDHDSVARWVTIAARRDEVREVVVAVQFPRGDHHDLWRIEHVYLELLNAGFGPSASGDPDDILGHGHRVELGPSGFAVVRFNNPRPGMHYGLGWR